MVEHYIENGRFPLSSICISFDDGWKDSYTNAFPILKKYGVTATMFLVTSCIGQVSDRAVGEGEAPRDHLSESDIREMAAAGIEFGSHSVTHPHLNKLDADEIARELNESKNDVEDLLQQPCKVLSYPAGFYSETVRSQAELAGYIAGFSTCYGRPDPLDLFALNREEILRRDWLPFRFRRKISRLSFGK